MERGGRERKGEGREWGGGLDVDICPGAPEFLVTPLLTNKAYLNATTATATNICQVFTYKMAAKINWRRYGTKLLHCHPMCTLCIICVMQRVDHLNDVSSESGFE